MIERRKSRRYRTKLLLSIVYRDETDNLVVEESIVSEDISIGGLRIGFSRQLPKGKILDLNLFLFSDPIQLSAQGKVAWFDKRQGLESTGNGKQAKLKREFFWVGIEFINIDSFTRERILRWIKKEFKVKEA